MPPVTKWWLTGAVVSGLATRLGLLSPYSILLSFPAIFKLQVRRAPVAATQPAGHGGRALVPARGRCRASVLVATRGHLLRGSVPGRP